MPNPTISIIIPTYNRAYCIGQAIKKIQQQTFADWELIIIDDGSGDNTREIVMGFERSDNRVKYIHQNNQGPSIARNRGLSEAVGRIIVYVDSDDELDPNFLSVIVDSFDSNDKRISYGIVNHIRQLSLVDNQGKILSSQEPFIIYQGQATLQQYYHWEVKTCGTGIFHSKEILANGITWDKSLRYLEDWDFLLQMGNRFPENFIHIPEPLFKYNQAYGSDGLCSAATYKNWADAFSYVYQKHKNDFLMKEQNWYPERVEKYNRLQKMVEEGKEPMAMYKYFPDFAN